MLKKNILFLVAVLILLIPSMAQVTPRDEDIQFRWKISFKDDVSFIKPALLNKEPVLLVVVNKTIYVINKEGKQSAEYTISGQGKIYAVAIGDVDADWRDEVLAGTGWVEKEDVPMNQQYDVSKLPPENVDILYMIQKSRGSLYIFDEDKIRQWTDVDQWVRSIAVTDINGDKLDETVVISSGYIKNYYKRYTDVIYKHYVCEIEWERDPLYIYDQSECNCAGCIWDKKEEACYLNNTWEECFWSETKDKGWNQSDKTSSNSSIVISNNQGKVLIKSKIKEITSPFFNAEVANLYRDSDQEIILGADNSVHIIRQSGENIAKYPQKADVRYVYAADLSGSGDISIVFDYRNASSHYKIAAINKNGITLWSRSVNSTNEAPIVYATKPTEGASEILYALGGIIYALDSEGRLEWYWAIKHQGFPIKTVSSLAVVDTDSDKLDEIVFASSKTVYNYEIAGSFMNMQRALNYLERGRESYERQRYAEAKTYVEKAKRLYEEIKNTQGVSEAESLLRAIESKLSGEKKVEADSQYARALTYYSTREYQKAKEHAAAAKEIYLGIGDTKKASQCDALIKMIDEAIGSTTTRTTLPPIVTTTQATEVSFSLPQEYILPAAALLLLIVIGFIAKVRPKRQQPKEEKKLYGLKVSRGSGRGKKVEVKLQQPQYEEGLKQEWAELEVKWKKLEEI